MKTTNERGGQIRRAAAALIAASAVGCALTACGGKTVSAAGGGAGSAQATGSGSRGNGTLNLYIQTPPTSLNPALSSGQDGQLNVDAAYSSLIYLNGENKFEPALAKSFRFIGKDNMAFQITLRPNVRFSDGTLLTAQAVKKYVLYAIKAAAISQGAFPLKKITTPNATTVDFYFTAPMPFAETKFEQSFPLGSPISPKAIGKKTIGYETFGAGPYELAANQTTSGSVYTYVKNPHYFDPAQQRFKKIVIKVVGDPNSAIQATAAAGTGFTLGAATENKAATAAGLRLTPSAYTMNYGMMLLDRGGSVVPALAKQQVREALNYAVNRDADAQALGGKPTEQLIAPGFVGHYSPDIYSYDVAKAKRLLSQAGYPHGFTFTAVVNGGDPTAAQTAQMLVSQLAKVGVTMKLTSAPTQNQFAIDQASKKYPAAVEQLPANDVTFLALTVLPHGYFNVFDMAAPSASYQDQYNAAGAKDGAAARAAWAQLGREAAEYAWSVPVAVLATPYYATDNLVVPKSWGPTPDPVYFTTK